jgi:hypothetical protein
MASGGAAGWARPEARRNNDVSVQLPSLYQQQ